MNIWNELRQVPRTLLHEPGFAAAAILTIALGVGANTAVFSIVNGVLLRPLSYQNPERLVAIHEVVPAFAHMYPLLPASACHFTEWRRHSQSFDSLSAIGPGSTNLSGAGEPERVDSERVSANLFGTLGVRPALGRGFAAGEDQDGRNRVAILSDSLWRRRFHSEPGIIGKPVTLNAQDYTIIGVMPPSFRFPAVPILPGIPTAQQPEVFVPLVFSKGELGEQMGNFNYSVIGRLKTGVTREKALAELDVIGAQLAKASGDNVDLRASVSPLSDAITGSSRHGLLVLLGAVGSVLLIVCVNLANLTLVRGERKARESAIRTALGASAGRLIAHALTESLLIAFAGGALGLAIAAASLGALIRNAPSGIPRVAEVSLDSHVLLFAFAITTATGLLFGMAPAWHAARTDPQNALKSGGRSATSAAGGLRVRGALVTTEVALSALLLVTAALLMSSFGRILEANRACTAPTVLAGDISVPEAKYGDDRQRASFYQRLLSELGAQPGVVSAGISNALPLQGELWVDSVSVPGDTRSPWAWPSANVRFVNPDYLRTMGIPVLAGRTFSENDRNRKVVMISERLARTLWPGQDPVGRTLEWGTDRPFEVIGVAADVRANADKRPVSILYSPYWSRTPLQMTLVARAAGDPSSIAGAMRAAMHRADADVPLQDMRTMREVFQQSVAERRFQMLLAGVFAATALLLASLGIYGVVSYSVTRRTNEMGIRMALGAQSYNIYGMVLRQAMTPVVLGLAAGLGAALAAGRVLASLLYEVSPRDPFTIAAVALLLAAVGLAACVLPALRATRLDPLAALRCE